MYAGSATWRYLPLTLAPFDQVSGPSSINTSIRRLRDASMASKRTPNGQEDTPQGRP